MAPQQRKAHKLPLIVPVVLYGGGRRSWKAARRFSGLVDVPAGASGSVEVFIPDFEYQLEDLNARTDEEIMGLALTALVQVSFLALKHIHDPDLSAQLESWVGLLRRVMESAGGLQDLHLVLHYVSEASESVTAKDFEVLGGKLGSAAEELVMTLAEKWRREGLEKGREEGLRLALQRQLRLKFGEELPGDVLRRLDPANDDQITFWIERILSATTLDDVFRS